ncbi:hypothetical protein BGW38_002577 [Lunasporangiospora selenospora]|uniref:Uncharacterized protein n=1 Tax=Lunasporangiospora selenospora TaxID=979761 RepID=A0A9P6KHU0_9FUNG|nr:hypothetical protein BGW38_002577 [Lunasporangiospora selenospora]
MALRFAEGYVKPRLASPNAEELLRICHEDIQVVLDVWGIISYPSLAAHATDGQEQALDSPISVNGDDPMRQLSHIKDLSSSSLSSQQQQQHYDNVSVDLLALLESSTKAISSIRNYSMHAPILSNEALTIHRQAALSVIEMLSLLELGNRLNDTEGQGINQPDGYCYARLQFGDLEEERAEMKKYLMVVQDQLFKPQAEQIETKLERLLTKQQTMAAINHSSPTPTICTGQNRLPDWINDHAWQPDADGNVSLERCHAFLEFFRPETRRPIPSPTNDLEGFIQALRDGYVMCMVFNSFISLTNMPFGIVDKIHEDTKRTWRGADNWRFLIQACRFRLEFKIVDGSFKPIDIVRQTDLGRHQLQTWLRLIVQRGIEEAQETLESKKTLPLAPPSPIFMDF